MPRVPFRCRVDCCESLCRGGVAVEAPAEPADRPRSSRQRRTTEDRPGPRRRRRQGRRARRRAEGSRGAARSDRCIAGTSMGALIGAGYASGLPAAEMETFMTGIDWAICHRWRRPPVAGTDRAEASRRRREHTGRARIAAWPHRHAWRAHQHQRHRRPASQLRGARAHGAGFRSVAHSVQGRGNRHGHGPDGRAQERRSRHGHAREHGDTGSFRARDR